MCVECGVGVSGVDCTGSWSVYCCILYGGGGVRKFAQLRCAVHAHLRLHARSNSLRGATNTKQNMQLRRFRSQI